jgi:tetraacyldisaccharide 4'-kinase
MTLYVANHLRDLGYRVAILSRGYKGGAEKRGGIVSDGRNLLMTPQAAGDEPFMMARFLKDVPVLVGRNRLASGLLAISRFSPDVLLLDDGFQHRRLHRDVDIVLLDSTRPFGNTFLLPRGSLREPPEALSRADALVFTRWHDNLPDPTNTLPESVRGKPLFFSRNQAYIHNATGLPSAARDLSGEHDPERLKNSRVFAFSAIADNRDFHRVLSHLGCQVVGTAEFADHHAYSPGELEGIAREAGTRGAELLATTQKDFAKIPPGSSWPLPLVTLGVLPSFMERKKGFDDFLKTAVENASSDKSQGGCLPFTP